MSIQAFEGFDNLAVADLPLLSGWTYVAPASGAATFPTGRLAGQAFRWSNSAAGFTTPSSAVTGVQRALTGAPTNIFFGFAFRVVNTGVGQRNLLAGIRGPTAAMLNIVVIDGALVLRPADFADPELAATLPGVVPTGVWMYLEGQINMGGNNVLLRLNGSTTNSINYGVAFSNGNVSMDRIAVGGFLQVGSSVAGCTFPEVDDFYVVDSTGAAPLNTFLGDVRVTSRLPTTDVTSGWTRSTGATNFGTVDEVNQNGDTDYVTSAVATTIDRYSSTTIVPGTNPVVRCVGTRMFARKTDATARTIRNRVRSVASTADGATVAMATSYAGYDDFYPLDPNGGIAWTKASVQASEYGPEVVT